MASPLIVLGGLALYVLAALSRTAPTRSTGCSAGRAAAMTRKRRRLMLLALGLALLGAAHRDGARRVQRQSRVLLQPERTRGEGGRAPAAASASAGWSKCTASRATATGRSVDFRVTDGKTDIAVSLRRRAARSVSRGTGRRRRGPAAAGRRLCREHGPRQARREIHAARGRRRAEEERPLAGGRRRRGATGAMKRTLAFLLVPAVFGGLVVVLAVGLQRDPHLLPSALIDRPAPDFALPGLDGEGQGLRRDDLGGGVKLVNFFASWCAPCRSEHQQLMTLAQDPGVTLYGIVYKDEPQASRAFSRGARQPVPPHRRRSRRPHGDRFRRLRRARNLPDRPGRPYPLPPSGAAVGGGYRRQHPATDPPDRRLGRALAARHRAIPPAQRSSGGSCLRGAAKGGPCRSYPRRGSPRRRR